MYCPRICPQRFRCALPDAILRSTEDVLFGRKLKLDLRCRLIQGARAYGLSYTLKDVTSSIRQFFDNKNKLLQRISYRADAISITFDMRGRRILRSKKGDIERIERHLIRMCVGQFASPWLRDVLMDFSRL
jgi:hypothetical protein